MASNHVRDVALICIVNNPHGECLVATVPNATLHLIEGGHMIPVTAGRSNRDPDQADG
jgi:hypothetical protein